MYLHPHKKQNRDEPDFNFGSGRGNSASPQLRKFALRPASPSAYLLVWTPFLGGSASRPLYTKSKIGINPILILVAGEGLEPPTRGL